MTHDNEIALKELATRNDANRNKLSTSPRVDRTDVVKEPTAYQIYMESLKNAK